MDIVASCRIHGGAHGYVFAGELVVLRDGRCLRRTRSDLGDTPFEPAPVIDLAAELAALARTTRIERGRDRRWATIELAVGDRHLTYPRYPRPLAGDVMMDHPADRLYAAIWGWPAR